MYIRCIQNHQIRSDNNNYYTPYIHVRVCTSHVNSIFLVTAFNNSQNIVGVGDL